MGTRNSTLTRAAPLFDELRARDSSGNSWIRKLLDLFPTIAAIPSGCDLVRFGWGRDEIGLRPPTSLLRMLVEHPELLRREALRGCTPEVSRRREALINGDGAMRREAVALLERHPQMSRGWHILEGETYPDLYLETNDLVVVGEGKRTEAGITTSTTWMPVRHQMLRHLDAAWERRGSKRVCGFFIVEGGSGADVYEVPPIWRDACAATTSDAVLRASLPHRTEEERRQIAACFVGATTWRRICLAVDVPWTTLPDDVIVDA